MLPPGDIIRGNMRDDGATICTTVHSEDGIPKSFAFWIAGTTASRSLSINQNG